MASYPDLSPCSYMWPEGWKLLAVGWLESGDPVPKLGSDTVRGPLVEKLRRFLVRDQPELPVFAGFHVCSIGPCSTRDDFEVSRCGSGELYVPHLTKAKTLYCAPRLVIHYITDHDYGPPAEFIEAVSRFEPEDVPVLKPDMERYRRRDTDRETKA